ncbi:MAG: penicillin-binding protein 2 [Parachlamydiaceae bacterium]|nr:penicillin-binding protein 2 [Parachlamydiaceae bacterium]
MSRAIKDPINRADCFRLLCLLVLLIALFSLVLFSFYRLQIIEVDKWRVEANRQHYFSIKEPFIRGSFISNNSIKKNHPEKEQKFVVDIEKFHLHIDPQSIPEEHQAAVAKELTAQLFLDDFEESKLQKQLVRKSRNRKLFSWLDKGQRDQILSWWQPFAKKQGIARNALFFVVDYQRSYPFNKLLGQLLHTTQAQKDESQQSTPTGGLELQFDSYLKGSQGKRQLMRSPKNSFESGEIVQFPSHGADVYLTINHYLQTIVEEELEKGVGKCRAKGGWAVMMAPRTGEILAIAQYPFFYPADYQQSFKTLAGIENTHLKAVNYAYEPGSVIKAITLYAALEANEVLLSRGEKPLFNPDEIISTANGKFVGRSKPLKDTSFHQNMNMAIAIQKSGNIYMAKLAEKIVARLGAQWYRDLLNETFGLGKKTGIEFPSEATGMIPKIGKRYKSGALEWSAGTPLTLSIGYNLQVNTIQLISAYAMFANGGYAVKPTLVRQIVKANSVRSVLLDNTSRWKDFPLMLKPNLVKQVVQAMKYTTKPGGTGSRGEVNGYTEAGKTSTSKKIANGVYSESLYRTSFIGFTPLEDPAFVLYVIIDEPEYGFKPGLGKMHHGGITAAPIFKQIAKRSLEYLGVAPDDPYGYPNGDPRSDPEKADWVPETKKLLELYKKWN